MRLESFVLIFALYFSLISVLAEGRAFVHFGRCKTKSDGNKGICLKFEDCDFFHNKNYTALQQIELQCEKDIDHLFCCPTHSQGIERSIVEERFDQSYDEESIFSQPSQCRQLTDRVSFGVETKIDEYPWTVLLEYTDVLANAKSFKCGGSLISNRWILTAAHCTTYSRQIKLTGARLGEWNTETPIDCEYSNTRLEICSPPPRDISIDLVIPHEEFQETQVYNDIALLRLSQTVEFNDYLKPICLPLQEEQRKDSLVGAAVTAAGWGNTENTTQRGSTIKRKAELSVWSEDACQRSFQRVNIHIDNNTICALGRNGEDTCHGDSGGPLMFETYDNEHKVFVYLAGVTSFGLNRCGRIGNRPALYTRVGAYIDWIKATIKKNSNNIESNVYNRMSKNNNINNNSISNNNTIADNNNNTNQSYSNNSHSKNHNNGNHNPGRIVFQNKPYYL